MESEFQSFLEKCQQAQRDYQVDPDKIDASPQELVACMKKRGCLSEQIPPECIASPLIEVLTQKQKDSPKEYAEIVYYLGQKALFNRINGDKVTPIIQNAIEFALSPIELAKKEKKSKKYCLCSGGLFVGSALTSFLFLLQLKIDLSAPAMPDFVCSLVECFILS